MKKLVALILTLTLILGAGTAVYAKPSNTTVLPDKSTYQFSFALPNYVIADKDAALGVTLQTTVLGAAGYDGAYVSFSAAGAAGSSVIFTKDAVSYTNNGNLAAFNLPAQYSNTADWMLKFSDAGTYNVTFNLLNSAAQVIATKTQQITVTNGAFTFTVPEKVYTATEATITATCVTEQVYNNIHYSFVKTSGPGTVTLKAEYPAGTWTTYTDAGSLAPIFNTGAGFNDTKTYKVTFSQEGKYRLTFNAVAADSSILITGYKDIVVKNTAADEEEDEINEGSGNTRGILNAVLNHLKHKKSSKSLEILMQKLEDRGLAQDILDKLEDAIADLEASIDALEAAIAASGDDPASYKILSRLKALEGKRFETYVNGKKVNYEDSEPVLKGSRTLVPFRKLAEILGAEITWDQQKKQITAVKDGKTVVMVIGKTTATVNGKIVTLDAPARLEKNRTLVPLRFLAQALDTTVDYYSEGALISINKNAK